jgi:hypothetical protein
MRKIGIITASFAFLCAVDVQSTYWHTPEDTLEKVARRSLAIVGHVFLETLPALEKKFR